MRKALFTIVVATALAACADRSPTSLRSRDGQRVNSIEDDPKITFDVTGFTYGPGRHPTDAYYPTCSKGTSSEWTWSWIIWQFYDRTLQRDVLAIISIADPLAQPCTAMSGGPGGDAYIGGTISIAGSAEGGGIGLGSTPARWDRQRTIADFPISAYVILTPYAQNAANCPNPQFSQWIIDNNWGAPRYDNPLVMSGSEIANRRVSGEFFCTADSPPPPPPPDDPPPCDDPSLCEGGGAASIVMSGERVQPSWPRQPSASRTSKKAP
jgi:hypothetical protein